MGKYSLNLNTFQNISCKYFHLFGAKEIISLTVIVYISLNITKREEWYFISSLYVIRAVPSKADLIKCLMLALIPVIFYRKTNICLWLNLYFFICGTTINQSLQHEYCTVDIGRSVLNLYCYSKGPESITWKMDDKLLTLHTHLFF